MKKPDDGGLGCLARRAASIFSGGGLADIGLDAAGYTPVFAAEYDEDICRSYAANLGTHVVCGAVQDLDYRPLAGIDLLWASPPCTRASVANQSASESPLDFELAAAVCRAIRESRPRFFALENVRGYVKFESYGHILTTLRDLGYSFSHSFEQAANYGVPQSRNRLILRARRDGQTLAPMERTHCKNGSLLELPWVGWYEAVEDLLSALPDSQLAPWQISRLPKHLATMLVDGQQTSGTGMGPPMTARADSPAYCISYKGGGPRAVLISNAKTQWGDGLRAEIDPAFSVTSQQGMRCRAVLVPQSDTAVKYMGDPADTVMACGEKSIPPRAVFVGDHKRQMRSADEPANTVRTWGTGGGLPRAILQYRVAQMTPRCLARFQSVPDSYILPEKRVLACRIIGNGVPPLLASAVARSFE